MHDRTARRGRAVFLRASLLSVIGTYGLSVSAGAQTLEPWSSAGGNFANTHAYLSPPANIGSPVQLNPSTASRLALKWSVVTAGDISATPTLETGGLYVPDWGGKLYKLDPETGATVWSRSVCEYTSSCYTATASISRTAPAIGRNVVVIGDAVARYDKPNFGSVIIGVDKATGAKVWSTVINATSKYASVLGSPVIFNNVAYVGTASWEEGIQGTDPTYKAVFRGNVVALDVATGRILWNFYTVPPGYTGGAVPGSSMAILPSANALLLATGNNYSVPPAVANCIGAAGPNIDAQTACLDPTDFVDSMVALDLTTGALKWGRRMSGPDAWTEACYYGNPNCPKPSGIDSDFAQAPMLTWVPNFVGVPDDRGGTSQNYMMAAGQKSSIFYALNPLNGGLFWKKNVGIGGMEWGSAVNTADFNHFYFALNNPDHVVQTIIGKGGTAPQTWNAGAWGALDVRTGSTQWMVPTLGTDYRGKNAAAPGCLTFANRLLFAGSNSGVYVALDATTGYRYWSYSTAGTVVSCPAVFNETLYWGTGYARNGVGKHMLYAFAVPKP